MNNKFSRRITALVLFVLIIFAQSAGDAENIDEVILSGGGACVPGLKEILTEKHDMEFRVNDAVGRIDRVDNLFEDAGDDIGRVGPLLTVALGLALRRGAV